VVKCEQTFSHDKSDFTCNDNSAFTSKQNTTQRELKDFSVYDILIGADISTDRSEANPIKLGFLLVSVKLESL